MRFKLLLPAAMLLFAATARAQQGIAVNATGNAPDPSAMLDVQSTAKGMLVPRMSAAQRTAINPAATGLLVYDTDSNKFIYYTGSAWTVIAVGTTATDTSAIIADADRNTKVVAGPDDKIHFTLSAAEYFTMNRGTLEWNNTGGSLYLGEASGIADDYSAPQYNVGVGANSLQSSTTGYLNAALGYKTLQNLTSGLVNVAVGPYAGNGITSGQDNIAVGNGALENLATGSGNVAIGTGAGTNATGSNNVYLGKYAGFNATGSNKLFITNEISSSPLIFGDFSADSLRINGVLNVNGKYTLPKVAGTTGQVLTYNGSGQTGWTNVSAVSETDPQVSSATSNAFPYWNGSTLTDGNIYNNNGNIGIGVAAAAEPLEVNGTSRFSSATHADIQLNSATRPTIYPFGTNVPGDREVQLRSAGNAILFLNEDNAGNVQVAGGGGNVKIGTGTPISKLDVDGTITATNPGTSPSGSSISLGSPSQDVGVIIKRGNGAGSSGIRWDMKVMSDSSIRFRYNNTGTEKVAITAQGNMGIGTTSPGAKLDVSGTLANGSGHTVTGTNAFASGTNNTAGGTNSVALGNSTTASGTYSLAVGSTTTASGNASVAAGTGSVASNWGAVAMGLYNTASSTAAVSLGSSNTASGEYGFSVGRENTASGNYSVAMGRYANTNSKGGSFVLADSTNTTTTNSDATNQMKMRFQGGYKLYADGTHTNGIQIAPTTGVAKYFNNVAASYDARSLVDKNYVDSNVAAATLVIATDTMGIIADADGNTKVAIGPTDDKIRFSLGGTERFVMNKGTLEFNNTSGSIYLGEAAGANDPYTNPYTYNIGIGPNSLQSYNTTLGGSNVAIGRATMNDATSGDNNVAIGYLAEENMVSGSENTAVGSKALRNIGGNIGNTALGRDAGHSASGDYNVFLGYQAGYNATGGNQLYIDNTNTTAPLLYGNFSTDSLRVNGKLNINGYYSLPQSAGTNGYVLTTNGAGQTSWAAAGAASETDPQVSSATTSRVPRWNGTSLADGAIYDDGTNIGIGTTTLTDKLNVSGNTTLAGTVTLNNSWNMQTGSDYFLERAGTRFLTIYGTGGNTGIGTSSPDAKLDVEGDFKLGTNGTVLTSVIKNTYSASTSSIPANTAVIYTITVPNAALGASVSASPNADMPNGVHIASARVSSANTVTLKIYNTTAGAVSMSAITNYYLTVIN